MSLSEDTKNVLKSETGIGIWGKLEAFKRTQIHSQLSKLGLSDCALSSVKECHTFLGPYRYRKIIIGGTA